jgi:hypothetical protein
MYIYTFLLRMTDTVTFSSGTLYICFIPRKLARIRPVGYAAQTNFNFFSFLSFLFLDNMYQINCFHEIESADYKNISENFVTCAFIFVSSFFICKTYERACHLVRSLK